MKTRKTRKKAKRRNKRKVMTKTVRDRLLSSRELVAAAMQWRQRGAGELTKLLGPMLAPGETMPDLAFVQELCGRAVERRWHDLRDADDVHTGKTMESRQRIAERDQALADLYHELTDLRTVFRGLFGVEEANDFLSLAGETSRDPVALLRQADYATRRLCDRSRSFPEAKYSPSEEARAAWAEALAEKAETLRKAHERATLGLEARAAASADRRRALDEFNDVFTRLAGWLEATYRAAGLDRFADAVHPSGRRKGRLAAEVRRGSRRAAKTKLEHGADAPTVHREEPEAPNPPETGTEGEILEDRSASADVEVAAKLRCAVQHAGLAAHQQVIDSVRPDRRKGFEDRARDQGSLPS